MIKIKELFSTKSNLLSLLRLLLVIPIWILLDHIDTGYNRIIVWLGIIFKIISIQGVGD